MESTLGKNIFNLKKSKKKLIYLNKIKLLNNYHFKKSKTYKKIIKAIYPNYKKKKKLKEMPMLPVRIFKHLDLKSITNKNIYKIMFSSGTSSDGLSKIYLDKKNAKNQIDVLNKIFSEIVTSQRYPMLIISKKINTINKDQFNAQTAAILGFSLFSKKNFYLLDKNNDINYNELKSFKNFVKDKPFFIFGFTSKIYEDFLTKLPKQNKIFNNAILIHGGGWKKLENLKISNRKFKELLKEKFNISRIINYYGLVEQTGSIFIESEKCGYFHTSSFSDILIRDEKFEVVQNKKKGLIQLLSLLPTSYPGHNILTEDIGEIVGEDDCKCGLKGKYFLVHGRIKKAEIRGCSNFND